MQRNCFSFVVIGGFAALVSGPPAALAQSLGAADSYAVLGGSSVSAAGGGATVTGDVGVSPGTSITGALTVVAPFTTHNNDASAIAAQSSSTALYGTLAGTGGAVPLLAELGGTALIPGVYSFTSTANIAAGTNLTLNGSGVYVFQVGSAVTANVGSNIILAGGASACDVFWQVTSAATLNGNSFAGTVVAQAGITLGVGAALTGRALTTATGAVTLSGGNTVGGCSNFACPPITLAPATLPSGTVGVAYSQTITGSGGTAPYTFAVTAGTLPAGLTLTTAGALSGTPTAAGSSTVTVQGLDANSCPGVITYTIVIAAAACPVITLAPATMPTGRVGVAYSQQITATGGTAPYTFTVLAGTLPPGLTLTSTGLLSGTPTAVGSSTVTVQGLDANNCPGVTTYAIVIAAAACPVVTLAPATMPATTVGVAYSQLITASGGTAPYLFTVLIGTLPAGLTLTTGGLLSGTTTTPGSSTVTIQGTDANNCPGLATYTITVASALPTLPGASFVLLVLLLAGIGWLQLRRRPGSA